MNDYQCSECGQAVKGPRADVKPPYGFRLLDKVKDAPMLVGDLYWDAGKKQWEKVICDRVGFLGNHYARAIDPGHGFRLLGEDEAMPEKAFDFTCDGVTWHANKSTWIDLTPALYRTIPNCGNTLAIRVPCNPCNFCGKPSTGQAEGLWLCPEHLEPTAKRVTEWPKPISDVSDIPEKGRVLVWDVFVGAWSDRSLREMCRIGFDVTRFTHWMPQPPAPIPFVKSEADMERDAMLAALPPDRVAVSATEIAMFKAGIAHARKGGVK